VGLLADMVHNLADASTALSLWIAFALARRPANRRYTYGYGRAEDLAGIFIVLMIVASAAFAAWESVARLLHPQPNGALGWVAVAGLVGFLGNWFVAQYRISAGKRIGSAALVADGYHARTNSLKSLAAVAGAAGVWLGVPQADPIVGLAISLLILNVLKDVVVQIRQRLMDAIDPEVLDWAEATMRANEARGPGGRPCHSGQQQDRLVLGAVRQGLPRHHGPTCRHRAGNRPVIVPAVSKTANQLNASGREIKFRMFILARAR
jgi:cation diffusion facilitator family transporter